MAPIYVVTNHTCIIHWNVSWNFSKIQHWQLIIIYYVCRWKNCPRNENFPWCDHPRFHQQRECISRCGSKMRLRLCLRWPQVKGAPMHQWFQSSPTHLSYRPHPHHPHHRQHKTRLRKQCMTDTCWMRRSKWWCTETMLFWKISDSLVRQTWHRSQVYRSRWSRMIRLRSNTFLD